MVSWSEVGDRSCFLHLTIILLSRNSLDILDEITIFSKLTGFNNLYTKTDIILGQKTKKYGHFKIMTWTSILIVKNFLESLQFKKN